MLIDRDDEPYGFRLHKDRVYYASEALFKKSASIHRDKLVTVGTCFGKFTKTKKFKLHITAIEYLSQFAKYKIWIKPNGEQSFLYGNHCVLAHLHKISEDAPEHQGCIVFNSKDIPLGFAVTAKSAIQMKALEPTAIIAFHQSDIGEYLRDEDTLI